MSAPMADTSAGISLADRFSADNAKDFVRELSGPSYEGRLTGQPGNRRAAAWIAGHFAGLGMAVSTQDFEVGAVPVHTSPPVLACGSRAFEYRVDFAVHPRSAFLPQVRTGTGCAGVGAATSASWVIVDAVPQGEGLVRLSAQVQAAGGSGLLVPQIPDQTGFLAKRLLGARRVSLPVLSVRPDLLRQLAGQAISATAPVRPAQATGTNIVATIGGADQALADQPVLLTAHYDGVGDDPGRHFPAAGDNASGIAVLAEILRVITSSGWQPARPVLVVATDAEELGAQGSRAHAGALKAAGKLPAVLNIDMVGRFREAITVELGPGSDAIASALDQAGQLLEIPLVVGAVASDNRSYAYAGAPAAGLASGAAHYHSPLDSAELVEPAALAHAGRLMLAALPLLTEARSELCPTGDQEESR
jgi:aminopeptidase YwaD